MSLKQRLDDDIKTAMKAGGKQRVVCLRMLKARILEKEVDLRVKRGKDYELEDDETIEVIAGYAKQRRDSIESYRQGSRMDLVRKEEQELEIVSEYLPRQLSEDEVREAVREAIAETEAASVKDMGKVMKAVIPRLKGAADGKIVSRLVRELLQ